jgi:hypothetical protein
MILCVCVRNFRNVLECNKKLHINVEQYVRRSVLRFSINNVKNYCMIALRPMQLFLYFNFTF